MIIRRNTRTLALVGALALPLLVLSACEEEGPAEQTGRAIDEAVEDAGEAVEDAGEAVDDAVEDAGEGAPLNPVPANP